MHITPARLLRRPRPAESLARRLHELLSSAPRDMGLAEVSLVPTAQGVEVRLAGVPGEALWAALCSLEDEE